MEYTPDELRAIAARVHHAEAGAALEWAADEIERVQKAWSFWKRALIDEYSTMLNATQEDRARAIERAEKAETELAAVNTALEDKHRAWVAAERELEAARSVVEAAWFSLDATRPILERHATLLRTLEAYNDAARRAGE